MTWTLLRIVAVVLLLWALTFIAHGQGSGLHLRGRLTATEQEAQEGYFAFCSDGGVCHATDALVLTADPKNPLLPHLRAMAGRTVQLSLFPVNAAP